MNENTENPFLKIFTQVVGAILTAVILYFIGININGERAKPQEKELPNIEKDEKIVLEMSKNENRDRPNLKRKAKGVGVFLFTGTVVDKNSNALAGIEAAWGDQKDVTRADGSFSLKIPDSLKGEQLKIVLSKNGKSYIPIENPSGSIFIFPPN